MVTVCVYVCIHVSEFGEKMRKLSIVEVHLVNSTSIHSIEILYCMDFITFPFLDLSLRYIVCDIYNIHVLLLYISLLYLHAISYVLVEEEPRN